MFVVILVALCSTALYYLGSRAKITSWLWSRYPAWLAGFMDCAACSGFWYGFGLAFAFDVHLAEIREVPQFVVAIIIGLCSIVWTPLLASLHDFALYRMGSVVPESTSIKITPSREVSGEIDVNVGFQTGMDPVRYGEAVHDDRVARGLCEASTYAVGPHHSDGCVLWRSS